MARVAIVTTSYPRDEGDAAGHFVRAEARLRVAAGDTVTVLAPGGGRSPDDGVTVQWLGGGAAFGTPGVLARLRERPHRAPSAVHFVARAWRALARLERAGAVDLVIAHWLVPSAFPIALGSGLPLEVVVHGTDGWLFERLPTPLRRAMARALAARRARVRCVSEDLRARLVRAAPALSPLCRVEPAALDVSGAPSRAAARRALHVGEHERVAVIASRLLPSKRPEVAARLALSRGASRVVVLGEGPLGERLARLDAKIDVLGQRPRPETLTWIAAADVVVSASLHEGAPTVLREARALGVPVLAVPAGDLRAWAAADPGIELVDGLGRPRATSR